MELMLNVDFQKGEIHGEGSDGVGEFDIDGTIFSNSLEFVKQYRVKHAVYYEGEFEGQEIMKGKWGMQKG
jgi:hypothetical protein